MRTSRSTTLAVGIATAVTIGMALAQPTDAAPPRCQLLLTVFEDGSWGADEAYIDGRRHTDTWLITPKRHEGQTWRNSRGETVLNVGAPALYRGSRCTLHVGQVQG